MILVDTQQIYCGVRLVGTKVKGKLWDLEFYVLLGNVSLKINLSDLKTEKKF